MYQMTRREFATVLGMAGGWSASSVFGADGPSRPTLARFGMVADSHYADRDDHWAGQYRFPRSSLAKMDEAVAAFNKMNLDFIIELGDLKDVSIAKGQNPHGNGPEERKAILRHSLEKLEEIEKSFRAFKGDVYHVCGNHDFDVNSEEEFYSRVANGGKPMTRGYYAFEKKGVKFVVLDANYEKDLRHYSGDHGWNWTDANLPPEQLKFLEDELGSAKGPCVVFVHQILHPDGEGGHVIGNAAEARAILEKSGKVKTVLMGHQHSGAMLKLNGILYYALKAQACHSRRDNCFATVDVLSDGSAAITGFGKALSCGI